VIAAMYDPNPLVAGKGLAILADAGIESAVGLLKENAEDIVVDENADVKKEVYVESKK